MAQFLADPQPISNGPRERHASATHGTRATADPPRPTGQDGEESTKSNPIKPNQASISDSVAVLRSLDSVRPIASNLPRRRSGLNWH